MLSLQLGRQERRSARLANPRLSFLQRTYEGSIGFLIECPWRLDAPDGISLSYLSCMDSETRPILAEVPDLAGLEIESFSLDERALDLDLHFRGGYRLRCFCAEVTARSELTPRAHSIDSRETRQRISSRVRNNWSFWSPAGAVVIGPSGQVVHNDEAPLDKMRRRLREIMDDDPGEPD